MTVNVAITMTYKHILNWRQTDFNYDSVATNSGSFETFEYTFEETCILGVYSVFYIVVRIKFYWQTKYLVISTRGCFAGADIMSLTASKRVKRIINNRSVAAVHMLRIALTSSLGRSFNNTENNKMLLFYCYFIPYRYTYNNKG